MLRKFKELKVDYENGISTNCFEIFSKVLQKSFDSLRKNIQNMKLKTIKNISSSEANKTFKKTLIIDFGSVVK